MIPFGVSVRRTCRNVQQDVPVSNSKIQLRNPLSVDWFSDCSYFVGLYVNNFLLWFATAFLSAFSLNIIFFHISESFSFHSSCFLIHIVLHLFVTFFYPYHTWLLGNLTSMGVERYAAVLNEGLGGAKEELNYSGKSGKLPLQFGFSELKIVQLHSEIWFY